MSAPATDTKDTPKPVGKSEVSSPQVTRPSSVVTQTHEAMRSTAGDGKWNEFKGKLDGSGQTQLALLESGNRGDGNGSLRARLASSADRMVQADGVTPTDSANANKETIARQSLAAFPGWTSNRPAPDANESRPDAPAASRVAPISDDRYSHIRMVLSNPNAPPAERETAARELLSQLPGDGNIQNSSVSLEAKEGGKLEIWQKRNDGFPLSRTVLDSAGKIESHHELFLHEGGHALTTFDDNQKPLTREEYDKGNALTRRDQFKDGKLAVRDEYQDRKLSQRTEFDDKGRSVTTFDAKGEKPARKERFDQDGKLTSRTEYLNGKPVLKSEVDPKGGWNVTSLDENGKPAWRQHYDQNKRLESQTDFVDGKRSRETTFTNDNGKVVQTFTPKGDLASEDKMDAAGNVKMHSEGSDGPDGGRVIKFFQDGKYLSQLSYSTDKKGTNHYSMIDAKGDLVGKGDINPDKSGTKIERQDDGTYKQTVFGPDHKIISEAPYQLKPGDKPVAEVAAPAAAPPQLEDTPEAKLKYAQNQLAGLASPDPTIPEGERFKSLGSTDPVLQAAIGERARLLADGSPADVVNGVNQVQQAISRIDAPLTNEQLSAQDSRTRVAILEQALNATAPKDDTSTGAPIGSPDGVDAAIKSLREVEAKYPVSDSARLPDERRGAYDKMIQAHEGDNQKTPADRAIAELARAHYISSLLGSQTGAHGGEAHGLLGDAIRQYPEMAKWPSMQEATKALQRPSDTPSEAAPARLPPQEIPKPPNRDEPEKVKQWAESIVFGNQPIGAKLDAIRYANASGIGELQDQNGQAHRIEVSPIGSKGAELVHMFGDVGGRERIELRSVYRAGEGEEGGVAAGDGGHYEQQRDKHGNPVGFAGTVFSRQKPDSPILQVGGEGTETGPGPRPRSNDIYRFDGGAGTRPPSARMEPVEGAPPDPAQPQTPAAQTFNNVDTTGYIIGAGGINGGRYDMWGREAMRPSDFFKGNSDAITIAGDKWAHVKDGQKFWSPEIDKYFSQQLDTKYGKDWKEKGEHAWLRMSDTGGAFTGTWSGRNAAGPTRVDIGVDNSTQASDLTGGREHNKITLNMVPESDADRVAALANLPTKSGKPITEDHGYRDEWRLAHSKKNGHRRNQEPARRRHSENDNPQEYTFKEPSENRPIPVGYRPYGHPGEYVPEKIENGAEQMARLAYETSRRAEALAPHRTKADCYRGPREALNVTGWNVDGSRSATAGGDFLNGTGLYNKVPLSHFTDNGQSPPVGSLVISNWNSTVQREKGVNKGDARVIIPGGEASDFIKRGTTVDGGRYRDSYALIPKGVDYDSPQVRAAIEARYQQLQQFGPRAPGPIANAAPIVRPNTERGAQLDRPPSPEGVELTAARRAAFVKPPSLLPGQNAPLPPNSPYSAGVEVPAGTLSTLKHRPDGSPVNPIYIGIATNGTQLDARGHRQVVPGMPQWLDGGKNDDGPAWAYIAATKMLGRPVPLSGLEDANQNPTGRTMTQAHICEGYCSHSNNLHWGNAIDVPKELTRNPKAELNKILEAVGFKHTGLNFGDPNHWDYRPTPAQRNAVAAFARQYKAHMGELEAQGPAVRPPEAPPAVVPAPQAERRIAAPPAAPRYDFAAPPAPPKPEQPQQLTAEEEQRARESLDALSEAIKPIKLDPNTRMPDARRAIYEDVLSQHEGPDADAADKAISAVTRANWILSLDGSKPGEHEAELKGLIRDSLRLYPQLAKLEPLVEAAKKHGVDVESDGNTALKPDPVRLPVAPQQPKRVVVPQLQPAN